MKARLNSSKFVSVAVTRSLPPPKPWPISGLMFLLVPSLHNMYVLSHVRKCSMLGIGASASPGRIVRGLRFGGRKVRETQSFLPLILGKMDHKNFELS